MAAVPCAECNDLVATSASGCGRCGAPIRVAIPPPQPEEPPPATYGRLIAVSFVTLGMVGGAVAFVNSGKGSVATLADAPWRGPFMVPDTQGPVGKTIAMTTCRHDWRACADNRDWAESGNLTGPQDACLALAVGASRYGQVALDRSWSGPRFNIYISGVSIRQGYIVLADQGGLVRDAFGGWVRTPLHCTFDFVAREARSLTRP